MFSTRVCTGYFTMKVLDGSHACMGEFMDIGQARLYQ